MIIVDEIKAGRKDFSGIDKRLANLRYADLSDANFSHANLRGADLRGADLRGADLRGADLSDAYLYGANLCHADLRGADLRNANLYGADLRGANLYNADLRGTNLRVFQIDLWTIYIQKDVITIGCQRHSVKKWMDFTDEEISSMHSMQPNALNYWKQYKDIIFSIHAILENLK